VVLPKKIKKKKKGGGGGIPFKETQARNSNKLVGNSPRGERQQAREDRGTLKKNENNKQGVRTWNSHRWSSKW